MTELIPSANADFRPFSQVTFECVLYASDSSCYIGNVDITTEGKMQVKYKNSISARAAVGNSGHRMYGSVVWITSIS